MPTTIRAIIAAAALVLATSACTGSLGQQTPANGSGGAGANGGGAGANGGGAGANGGGAGANGGGAGANGGSGAGAGGSTISDDNPGSPHSDDPGGAGPVTNNQVVLGASLGPGIVTFGPVRPGGSVQKQFDLVNSSGQSVTVKQITVTGTWFSLATDCNGRPLRFGDSCAFSVTFAPQTTGAFPGTISVTTAPGVVVGAHPLTGLAGSPGRPSIPGQSNHANPSQPAKLGGNPAPSIATPTESLAPSPSAGSS
jgi:hypothetical protein